MSVVIGWDIGGAHLKAARVKHGRVEAVVQAATPLWLGLGSLEAAFDALGGQLGAADHHVITMTGELCDAFLRAKRVSRVWLRFSKSSRSFRSERLCGPRRLCRPWPSRFACPRHCFGQLARKRRARRAPPSRRAVHRHRLDDSQSHSNRRRPRRGSRLQRCGAACFGRTGLYRNDAQLRHVDGFAGAISRRLDAADERIFRQQRRRSSYS